MINVDITHFKPRFAGTISRVDSILESDKWGAVKTCCSDIVAETASRSTVGGRSIVRVLYRTIYYP